MTEIVKKKETGLKITFIGLILNAFLAGIKIFFGFLGQSQALVADGIHSLADLGTDLITALGIYLGNIPPDEDHPFGHQKIETITEILLGIVLISVAGGMIVKATSTIYSHEYPEIASYTIYIAAISIVVNEWLYWMTVKVSKRLKSNVIFMNAWHHRSDAMTSVVILIGLIVTYFFPKLRMIDSYLGIFVALIILKIGVQSGWDSLKRIVDTIPVDLYKDIENFIEKYPEVRGYHNLGMRYIGTQIHIEAHIEVDPKMSLFEAHEISHRIKDGVMEKFDSIYDVLIHMEPEGGDSRFQKKQDD